MCNACGNLCCGSDMFSGCGCDGCDCEDCWSDDDDFDDDDRQAADAALSQPTTTLEEVKAELAKQDH